MTDIKLNSPAHISGKIEDGDEIIQIEYQTVVGWHYKKVLLQLQDSPSDVIITLKKRPKHSKIYGQIYMKPYRLPSKKKTLPSRWGVDEVNPPALPRQQLLNNNHPVTSFLTDAKPSGIASPIPHHSPEKQLLSSDWEDGSDIATPTESKPTDFLLESRAIVQRRHTICADRGYCGYKSQMLSWHKFRHGTTAIAESPSLRDKSVSFGFGLDSTPRPTTHTGLSNHYNRSHDIKGSLPAIPGGDYSSGSGSDGDENSENSIDMKYPKPGVSKVVRFETKREMDSEFKDNEYTCKVDQTVLEVFEPIPYADDEDVVVMSNVRSDTGSICADDSAQAVNDVLVRREIAKWEQKVAATTTSITAMATHEVKRIAPLAKAIINGEFFYTFLNLSYHKKNTKINILCTIIII